MNMILYSNVGDNRQLNKNITKIADITAQYNDDVDMRNPVFTFTYSSNYINANYVYVKEWGRYYFITGKSVLSASEIEISCHIDVLMSYKNAILNSQVIAARSASNTEPYIPDPVVSDKGTVTYYTRKASTTPFTSSCYVLTVAGK